MTAKFLLLCYRDESLSGTELTSKLEPAFLAGLRCNQPPIRQKFVEVNHSLYLSLSLLLSNKRQSKEVQIRTKICALYFRCLTTAYPRGFLTACCTLLAHRTGSPWGAISGSSNVWRYFIVSLFGSSHGCTSLWVDTPFRTPLSTFFTLFSPFVVSPSGGYEWKHYSELLSLPTLHCSLPL